MNFPLLCFLSQPLEESICRILGFTEEYPPEPIVVSQTPIRKWKLAHQFFYSCVITVSGGKRGALRHVKKMGETFRGCVLFFDNFVTENVIRNAGVTHMRNLIFVNNVDSIQQSLNILLQGEQSYLLHEKLFAEDSRGGRRRFQPIEDDESTRDQVAFADRFVEGMLSGQHIEAPRRLMHDGVILNNPNVFVTPDTTFIVQNVDGPDEDAAFAHAQTLSMNHPQPTNRRRRRRRPPDIQESWKRVLKPKSDPIESNSDPVCITCHSNKATICFVECMHTVMCDECVTRMCSISDVQNECPLCRGEPKTIIRPIMAANSDGK